MRVINFYRCRTVFLIALAALSLPAHADKLHDAIGKANTDFSAAAAAGNAAGIAALYAQDGQLLPPGSEPLRGEAIQKYWQGALASGISGVLLKTVDLFGQGSIVTEVGEYELKSKEGQVLDHGKYIVVWRREGETWKLLRDMFSTNVASAPK